MVVWSNVIVLNKDHSQWECHPRVMALAIVPRESHGDDPGHLSLLLTLLPNQQFCWCVTVFNNHDTHMTLALRLINIWRPSTLPQAATKTFSCLKRASSQDKASSSRQARSSGAVLILESKVRQLRSFQIIQEVRITMESKHIRSAFATLARSRSPILEVKTLTVWCEVLPI